MQLTCEIIEISIDHDNYENHAVQFSCFDDDAGVVSFVDRINLAHASFLRRLHYDSSAYGKMISFMCEEGLEALTVGQKFESTEDEDDFSQIS